MKWQFDDPVSFDTYVFEINPSEGGSPKYEKQISESSTTDGTTVLFEGRDATKNASFSGVVLTQDQYNAMIEWFNKRYLIDYTDDLGRTFTIYITKFDPKRERAIHSPWKHSYTVDYVIVSGA